MHVFNPLDISSEIVLVKSVSLAVGGTMSILDTEQSTETNEVTKRLSVPFAVAREFLKRHDYASACLIPLPVNLIRYQDVIICMEAMSNPDVNKVEDWKPINKMVTDAVINNISADPNTWFFDGRYIYRFTNESIQQALKTAKPLSESNMFRSVPVITLDTMTFYNSRVVTDERSCIAFVLDEDRYGVSAPIWKNLTGIGAGLLSSDEGEDDNAGKSQISSVSAQFDTIDEKLVVNLEFALRAGRTIGRIFGNEAIEPLLLPQLMFDLNTINLPSLPISTKSTYAISLKFTEAVAWLLGLNSRAPNDINTTISLRQVIKHLTGRGICRRTSLEVDRIYQDGVEVEIPLAELEYNDLNVQRVA